MLGLLDDNCFMMCRTVLMVVWLDSIDVAYITLMLWFRVKYNSSKLFHKDVDEG